MKMQKTTHGALTLMLCCLVLLSVSGPLRAQAEPPDPVEELIFNPELVMQFQQAIGLSDEQRLAIKHEVQSAQARFTNLQWDLEREMESFLARLSGERVDEKKLLVALDRVLELESAIKKTHLVLAIRIKNLLNPEQQAQLRELRRTRRTGK